MCTEQFIRRSIHVTWILSHLKYEADWEVVFQFVVIDFSRVGGNFEGFEQPLLCSSSYCLKVQLQ